MSSSVIHGRRHRLLRTERTDARIIGLVDALRRAEAEAYGQGRSLQCTLIPREGQPPIPIGHRPDRKFESRFDLIVRNDRLFQKPLSTLSLGRAYVRGDLDIEPRKGQDRETYVKDLMAVFDLRGFIRSGTPISQALSLAAEFAFSPPTGVNTRAIEHDYALDTDFFHQFLDTHYHLYSQCRFDCRDQPDELDDPKAALNSAARCKLDHVWKELNLPTNRPQRILDIGSGWGGFTKYVNERGLDVHVTSLTLSENHKKYVEKHHAKDRPHEVRLEDFLRHRRGEFYDAVVILGVIEHMPTYRLFCERVWEVLKPNGRLYLDASATKEKFAANAFTRRYTWHGPHSCLALPDLVEELLFHGFRMVDVVRQSRDYERTMRAWALRLEANHEHVAATWGEYLYRAFRVFLWGGAHAFHTDRLQAYTLIAERAKSAGPRPRRARRTAQFLASLR